MKEYILGFDTSNYTTSVAIITKEDSQIKVVSDQRRLLEVPKGMRGIRQQDAVFNHLKNLPDLYKKALGDIDNDHIGRVRGVCVSTRPRPVDGSYMPCFLTGHNFAQVIAASLCVPVVETSHQEGHIEAIKHFSSLKNPNDFVCFHLSGGTMEILRVIRAREADYCNAHEVESYSCDADDCDANDVESYNCDADDCKTEIEIIGKSLDISFGQLIDRVGVKLGLDFPCGKEMDGLALKYAEADFGFDLKADVKADLKADDLKDRFLALEAKLKKFKDIKITGLDVNISGIETGFSRIIDSLIDEFEGNIPLSYKALIAGVLFEKIGKALGKLAKKCKEDYLVEDVVFAGGVSESRFLRLILNDIVFGDYGADNAIGVALVGGNDLWQSNL